MDIVSTRQKVGLVLAALINLSSIPSVLFPAPDGEDGPPMAVLVVSTILGVIGLVAVVLAWRRNKLALRVAAASLIVQALLAIPAFFADIDAGIKLAAGASVVVTIIALVLMFSPARRPAPALN
jgi:O-antigen/teichoic acid export membrane protein